MHAVTFRLLERGREALEFRLTGGDGKKDRRFKFKFKPNGKRDPFVPRLWAMRKIAVLSEALRDLGADSAMGGLTGDGVDRNDPRVKELVDEIDRQMNASHFGVRTSRQRPAGTRARGRTTSPPFPGAPTTCAPRPPSTARSSASWRTST